MRALRHACDDAGCVMHTFEAQPCALDTVVVLLDNVTTAADLYSAFAAARKLVVLVSATESNGANVVARRSTPRVLTHLTYEIQVAFAKRKRCDATLPVGSVAVRNLMDRQATEIVTPGDSSGDSSSLWEAAG